MEEKISGFEELKSQLFQNAPKETDKVAVLKPETCAEMLQWLKESQPTWESFLLFV